MKKIVVKFGGSNLKSKEDIAKYMVKTNPGTNLKLKTNRGIFNLKLAEHPEGKIVVYSISIR